MELFGKSDRSASENVGPVLTGGVRLQPTHPEQKKVELPGLASDVVPTKPTGVPDSNIPGIVRVKQQNDSQTEIDRLKPRPDVPYQVVLQSEESTTPPASPPEGKSNRNSYLVNGKILS